MSAVEGERADGHKGSFARVRDCARMHDDVDVPGMLAGHIAEMYAESERERRNIGVERAIARARASA